MATKSHTTLPSVPVEVRRHQVQVHHKKLKPSTLQRGERLYSTTCQHYTSTRDRDTNLLPYTKKDQEFYFVGFVWIFFLHSRGQKQNTQADGGAGDTSPRLTHPRQRAGELRASPRPRERPKQLSPKPRKRLPAGERLGGAGRARLRPVRAAPGPFLPSASGSSGVTWYRPTASALPRATPLPEPPHAVPPPPPLPSDLGMRENFFMASGAPGRTGQEPEASDGQGVPRFTCRPRHSLLLARRRLLKGRRRKKEEGGREKAGRSSHSSGRPGRLRGRRALCRERPPRRRAA